MDGQGGNVSERTGGNYPNAQHSGRSACIDVHCHVFNGRDVPVFEFGRQAFLDSDEDHIKKLLEPLLNLLVIFLSTAPTVKQERDYLEGGDFDQESLVKVLTSSFISFVTGEGLRPLYLGDDLDTEAYRQFVRLLGSDLDEEGRQAADTIAESIGDSRSLDDALLATFSEQLAERIQPEGELGLLDEPPGATLPTPGDLFRYIAWVNLFRQRRSKIASKLISLYGVDDPEVGRVQLFTTSFLDIEHWLDERWLYDRFDPPYTRLDVEPFQEQVELMELIARREGGRLMPIAPFDPWRQALYRRRKIGPEPLEVIKTAVTDWGFVGVKIYPPMGFQAFGNADLAAYRTKDADCDAEGIVEDGQLPYKGVNESDEEYLKNVRRAARKVLSAGNRFTFPPKAVVDFPEKDPNEPIFGRFGRCLDDALTELYTWCDKEGVPIMTHCRDSQGPKHCYARRSHPKYWEKVFCDHSGLRVNLGHFGDMFALSQSNPEEGNWAETVVEYAATYDGAYTDVGYFPHILYRDGSDRQHVKNFTKNLKALLKKYPKASNKIMYGSDWTMIGMERNAPAYFHNFSRLLYAEFSTDADAIRGATAMHFFGLTPNKENRDRLKNYYDKNGLTEASALLNTYDA